MLLLLLLLLSPYKLYSINSKGIFEFIQRVDIIGATVNKLPIIGPIRQQIIQEFKKSIDQVLGGQVLTKCI